MNKVMLTGNIGKDASYSKEGSKNSAYVSIAVNASYPFDKDKDGNQRTDWLNLRFIGEKAAEHAVKFLKTGSSVEIVGQIRRDVKKKEDGSYDEYNYIVVENWSFVGSKKEKSDTPAPTAPNAPVPTAPPVTPAPVPTPTAAPAPTPAPAGPTAEEITATVEKMPWD